ncbi:hypothetical protein ACTQ49_07105 [Luteococcus sp. Sow4_B9]|uniref:hypothetical protein n=1 Tax=Luteococcus sp. Sow4_B9 TaxID=3438792 RepID=UPI003F9456F7
MTSVEFLKLCGRRWYVLLLGLLATFGLTALAAGPTTVYATQATVNILDPDGGKTRIVGFHSPDSIAVANILAARVNGGVKTPLAANPDVSLQAIGILEGTHAQVRNEGSQWMSRIDEPVIDIKSVGSDPEQVAKELDVQIAEVHSELATFESELKVPKGQNMELTLTPEEPAVVKVSTHKPRAILGYGLFGVGLTLLSVVLVDRALRSRRSAASH